MEIAYLYIYTITHIHYYVIYIHNTIYIYIKTFFFTFYVFLRRGQTNTKCLSYYVNMHTRILAQIYFLFGYLTSISMFMRPELYLKFMGIFLASYLSYLISAQLEQNND